MPSACAAAWSRIDVGFPVSIPGRRRLPPELAASTQGSPEQSGIGAPVNAGRPAAPAFAAAQIVHTIVLGMLCLDIRTTM